MTRKSPVRYVREIEKRWAELLDRPVVFSPREWALMSDWHSRGIPLQLVFEAIDAAFDGEGRRRGNRQPPRSLAFVAPAVEEAWQVILEGRSLGEHPSPGDGGGGALAAWRARVAIEGEESALGRLLASLLDRLARGCHADAVEQMLEERLPQVLNADRLVAARQSVERALRPFGRRLDAATLARTAEHALVAELRRELGLPRLPAGAPAGERDGDC